MSASNAMGVEAPDGECSGEPYNGGSIETQSSTQSDSSLHDMNDVSEQSGQSAPVSPNATPKSAAKRRGRPQGSTKKEKSVLQMVDQLILDDEDLSRRRSSRLKTIEARKGQERERFADETSGDSSIVNASDPNESQHSLIDSSSVSTKLKKKKKSKKNKNRDKDMDCKHKGKHKKKSSEDKHHSYDDHNSDKCKTQDIHNNKHSSSLDSFTAPLPPSHYANIRHNQSSAQSSNADDSSPRPEKVKSRWRRCSELEWGHELGAGEHQKPNAQSVPIVIPKETEPHPQFDAIDENIYLFERRKSKSKKETRRMVCDCILTKEERVRGLIGCGEDCLNRMLMIECGSRCSLGDHCANKRFQKRQSAKVEPFRTARKGWGLRTLEPLQPNTFIMEYIGEVIDPLDFHNRTQKYSKEKREHHFFMALKSDEIIDATVKGNITRFVNHSCDPNSETQKWTVNGELRIGFFTQRFVQAGEEITFDYQFQRYGKEAQKCYCDAINCRGYIGATENANILTDGSKITTKLREELDESLEDEEVLEDLALEEEIAKLSEGGGLRNRQQVLMLARLMVRAEDPASRIKLINIIKGTVEMAYLRLLLDYHGLQLVWSWMVEVEDWELKAAILELLEILPIPNKTMLTDSKVFSVVERWSQQTNEPLIQSIDTPMALLSSLLPAIVEPIDDTVVAPSLELIDGTNVEKSSVPMDETIVRQSSEPIDETIVRQSSEPIDETIVTQSSEPIDETIVRQSSEPMDETIVTQSSEPTVEPMDETIVTPEDKQSVEVKAEVLPESVVCDSSGQTSDVIPIKSEPTEQTSEQLVTTEGTDPSNEMCSTVETQESDQTKEELIEPKDEKELPLTEEKEMEICDENKDSVNTCVKSSPRIELKSSSLSLVIKPRSLTTAPKTETPQTTPPVIKSKPSIASMAQKLLLNWKELKEVFRIPRLERQKRHEDEKEADRKTKEVEERRARGLPLTFDKRGIDDRDYTIAGILGTKRKGIKRSIDSKDTPNKKPSNVLSQQIMSSNYNMNKVSKEEHRKMFEMEVAQKDYQEALKRYHQQLAYYNAVYGPQYQAQQQQQQQQQLYPQEVAVAEQYPNGYNYEQYYNTDQSYYQPTNGYTVPSEASFDYSAVNTETQQMAEYAEENATYDENTIFSIETTPNLIPLVNFDVQVLPETESSLAIDAVPHNCVRYSDCDNKLGSDKSDTIFDALYPPPGVFYVTPNGDKYFTPIPIDRNQKAVPLVFDTNITVPFAHNWTKSLTTNKMPSNWKHNSDQNGNIYYYNKTKHKSQWIPPEEEKIATPVEEPPEDNSVDVVLNHKQSDDNEDSRSVPEVTPSHVSPKSDAAAEETVDSDGAGSTAPDSGDLVAVETENSINSNHNSPNILQTILALEADPRKRRQMLNAVIPSTTTAAADTSSSSSRKKPNSTFKIQQHFQSKMSEYVVHCLNPYRRPECRKGRILNNNDFKYLARKLTHTIMDKEIKHCKSAQNLSCNEAVKHKTKDYVKKYMSRFGPFYKPEKSADDRAVSPKDVVSNTADD